MRRRIWAVNDHNWSDDEILAAIAREDARNAAREKAASAQARDDKRAVTIRAERVA